MKKQILGIIINLFVEGPAKRKGLEGLMADLSKKQTSLTERFAKAEANEKHSQKLRHIIAIEKWGQNRLRVDLGQAYEEDSSKAYEPSEQESFEQLKSQFADTRAETLSIAKAFEEQGVDVSQEVNHNQMGPLSLLGWLRYLEVHASLEAKALK